MELSVKINAAIDGFVSAMKQANNEVQKLVSSTGKPVAVNADTSQATKAINGLQNEIKETQSELGKLGGNGALDGLKKSFAEGREQANSGGGIFGGIAGQLGQLVSPMGAATAGIGLLTAGLAASFTLGQEFETNLKSVSAVTGVTGAALEDIGNRAQNLAGKFGGSASDQLGVFQTALSKIGPQLAKDGESLNTFADNVNTLSKTDSALGAAGAVDALSGAMLQFGVNVNDTKEVARESSRFIQVLAASAGVGSASVSDVAASIANVGGTAKNANISFEELNAALQVQASKSIVGSAAGTGLTAVINKLQAASGPAADQLKTMGTSSEKLGQILTTKGIGAAMTELRGAMEKLGSTSEKNAFLVSMFGETGLNTAAALLGGGDMLAEFTKGVTGTNAATEQAAVNMDTLSEQMSRGKAALENYAISAFKVLAPIVSQVFSSITKAFSIISDTLAPIFSKLGETLGNVFTRIGAVLKPILAVIGGVLIANIVTSLSIAGTAVNVFYSTMVNIFDAIVEAISPVIDIFKKAFGFGNDVKSTFDPLKMFQSILEKITGVITFFGEILTALGGLFAQVLVVPINIIVALFKGLYSIFQSVVGLFKSGKETIKETGKETEKTGGFFTTLLNAIKAIPLVITAVTAGFKAFVASLSSLFDNFSLAKLGDLLSGKAIVDAGKKGIEAFNDALRAKKKEEAAKAESDDAKIAEESAKKEAAVTAKEKGKALKSLTEEIKKAKLENAKLLSDIDIKAIDDEKERDLKAATEKTKNAIEAVKNEVDKVKKEKGVVQSQRLELIAVLNEKEKILTEQGEQEKAAIRGKYALKELEDSRKKYEELTKQEIELTKSQIEQLVAAESTARTSGDLLTAINETNEAKRRLIEIENENEVSAAIEKNAAVLKSDTALKDAIRTGNVAAIEAAKKAYLDAVSDAENSDKLVLAVKQKGLREIEKADKESLARISDVRISAIEDDADRERAEREAAIQKTFAAELLAAAGNERLILDAHRKANAARYDSDEEYNRKTTDLATRTANTLQNLGMGIADGIAEMYGNTFNDLSKAFDDYAAGVQKKMESSGKEDTAKLEDETKTLRSQLAKREISYQDFQEKIAAIREKGEGGGAASATERANLAIGKSFGVMAKNATAGVEASLEEMKKLSKGTAQAIKEKGLSDKNVAKDFERFGKDIVSVGEGTAESVIGIFGQMAAAGTLTLKSAANAALGITIDTISKIVMAQAPAILAIFTGTIPPPFGFIAGLAAIGAVQLLLATAKGAIGADQGVVGIDGSYSTPRSSRDTIPIWVRDGESIINPEATAQNRALLKFINSTNRPASEFFSNSVVTANGNLQLAHSNQIRTAQLVTAGSVSGSQDFGAMQNSLANIERSLANAKILETRSKHTSAVQLTVTENRAYKIQQEKAALKLERARR